MVVTLHRFFDRLFGETNTAPHPGAPQQPQQTSPVRRGIPDGYLDKFPSSDERAPDRHYARVPATPPVIETPESHEY
jgi:hypothetical protein